MEFHRALRELWDRTARAEEAHISLRELQRRIWEATGVKVTYTYLGQLYNAADKPEEKAKQPSPQVKAAIARGLGYSPDVFDVPDKAEQTLRELDEFWELKSSGVLAMLRETRISMMARGLGGLDDLPEDAKKQAVRSGLEAMLNAIQQARGAPDSSAGDASGGDGHQ
ncbi:hypothetical protein ACFV1N_25155 [Streptosporangium canum]|uniref:hypothetical protein n=1 Tax=Streptosporangium canum TaxID=324952 RepID=UPI0036D021F8